MDWLDKLMEKFYQFIDKLRPGLKRTGEVLSRFGKSVASIWNYVYRLRAIIMAAPVAAVAAVLASINMNQLPDTVRVMMPGVDPESPDSLFGFLVTNSEYITRDVAVFVPLIITVAALLLMLCSKRTVYPWLISVFSLAIPLLLMLSNLYPQYF